MSFSMFKRLTLCGTMSLLAAVSHAQVSAYTFTQSVGTWNPIAGTGTPLGLVGLPPWMAIDDNAFVTQGQDIPLSNSTTGNGWPIGFVFTYNGQQFDRVGISTEGWIALGNSVRGNTAVFVSIGTDAYTPLSSPIPEGMDAVMRHRIVGFAADMAPGGGLSSWPIQIKTMGTAPNRTFITEFNCQRSGAGGTYAYQIRLNEGGGVPSAQTVQIVFGTMTASGSVVGQVGLGGATPDDFNNRSVTVAPYNWVTSDAGTTNAATCRVPAAGTNLPAGLTFTWTPPACSVFGVAMSAFDFVSGQLQATLSWNAVAGATAYDYVVTAGGPSDPPVASGSGITATSVVVANIPQTQELYVHVRAHCDGQPADWAAPLPFDPRSYVNLICGDAPQQLEHCYVNFEQRIWTFISSTDAPIRVVLQAGILGQGDLLTFYDGPTPQSPLLFTSATASQLPGQVVNSTGGVLTMRITADGLSSCNDTEWLAPIEWMVGCVDCQPVLANYSVVNDCPNDQFSVRVFIANMGSASPVVISNDGGAPNVTANALGQFTVGPFPIGTPVVVTAGNTVNAFCSSISEAMINTPCPVVSCGPDEYTYCYEEGDAGQWVYRATGNQRIGVRFLSGSLAANDRLRIYNGDDIFSDLPLHTSTGGDLAGVFAISTAESNTILIAAEDASTGSCVGGQATAWNYVVACYDGCEAPEATFTVLDDCDAGSFSIRVGLTSLGTASEVVVTNNAGAGALTATAVGDYTVGPFTNGTSVVLELEGASVLCSLNSAALTHGCGVGVNEREQERLWIYPDPATGPFNIMLPRGFGGSVELSMFDLSGRRVMLERFTAQGGQVILLDAGRVPAGSYVVVLRDGERAVTGTLRVVY